LDAESEGLIVLTNDGDLANRLTHPRYRHTKTYKVTVYGLPPAGVIQQWEEGIDLGEEGMTAPCSVTIVKGDKNLTSLRIIMTEGKKRQIRRVATKLGYPVRHLLRTHIGKLGLGELRPGEWRELNADDLKALQTPEVQLKAAAPSRRRSYRPKQSAPPGKSRGKSQRPSNRKLDHSRRTQRSNKRSK
jgi:pseudouridine synthase